MRKKGHTKDTLFENLFSLLYVGSRRIKAADGGYENFEKGI